MSVACTIDEVVYPSSLSVGHAEFVESVFVFVSEVKSSSLIAGVFKTLDDFSGVVAYKRERAV